MCIRDRHIADKVKAYLLVDMAHYSGLIAGNVYPSPVPYADFVTSTTHKTLRGPRGGIILWNNPDYTKKINSAIFPGTQGGPLMNIIAAKAQAFIEANTDEFKEYSQQVVNNAQAMALSLKQYGMKVLTDGTDSHIILLDLSDTCMNCGAELEDISKKNKSDKTKKRTETETSVTGTATTTTTAKSQSAQAELENHVTLYANYVILYVIS